MIGTLRQGAVGLVSLEDLDVQAQDASRPLIAGLSIQVACPACGVQGLLELFCLGIGCSQGGQMAGVPLVACLAGQPGRPPGRR